MKQNLYDFLDVATMEKMRGKKVVISLLAVMMILPTMAMPCVPVWAALFLAKQSAVQQLAAHSTEMSRPEMSDAASYFVLKASQEQTLASSKRAAQLVSPISEHLVFLVQSRLITEIRTYCNTNDLDYNLPPIIYRLSASEHATEG